MTAKEKTCDHQWINKSLNRTGDYVVFPSRLNHRGMYDDAPNKRTLTLQLFCTPCTDARSERITRSSLRDKQIVDGVLKDKTFMDLGQNVIRDWDMLIETTLSGFMPCRNFDGNKVDPLSNRQFQKENLDDFPLIKHVVEKFSLICPELTVDMAWLLLKSKPNDGFQGWHQDLKLSGKITNTIVVNVCNDELNEDILGAHAVGTGSATSGVIGVDNGGEEDVESVSTEETSGSNGGVAHHIPTRKTCEEDNTNSDENDLEYNSDNDSLFSDRKPCEGHFCAICQKKCFLHEKYLTTFKECSHVHVHCNECLERWINSDFKITNGIRGIASELNADATTPGSKVDEGDDEVVEFIVGNKKFLCSICRTNITTIRTHTKLSCCEMDCTVCDEILVRKQEDIARKCVP